jgi:hypothetical protein
VHHIHRDRACIGAMKTLLRFAFLLAFMLAMPLTVALASGLRVP